MKCTSRLCVLPIELVEIIMRYLNGVSFGNMRLTCKGMYAKSLYVFGSVYLHTLTTDLTSKNLERINALLQNEALALYPHILVIKNPCKSWPGKADRGYDKPLDLGKHDAVDLLIRSLRHFKNCRSFKICGTILRVHSMTSYEATVLLQYILVKGNIPAISFTVKCLSELNWYRKIRSCYAQFWDRDSDNNDDTGIPLNKPELLSSWESLRDLSIYSTDGSATGHDWFMQNIIHAPNLEKLTIDIHRNERHNPFLSKITQGLKVLGLQHLNCRGMSLSTGSDLQSLLQMSHHSLRHLSLSEIWMSLDGWMPILKQLLENFHSLTYIKLLNLVVYGSDERRKFLHFPISDCHDLDDVEIKALKEAEIFNGYRNKGHGVIYEGPHMKTVLGALVKCARYDPPL